MKYIYFLVLIIAMVSLFSVQAHAALELRGTDSLGNRLIYDSDLDITWYDYTSSANIWQNQLDWASALTVNFGGNIYNDWRLPTTDDPYYEFGYDGTTSAGFNITSSEIGHLFYTELGNKGDYDTNGNLIGCGSIPPLYCLTNTGDFLNLQPFFYWSETDSTEFPFSAWAFDFRYGWQDLNRKGSNPFVPSNPYAAPFAIAVRPGLAVVPEPISSILFVTGGMLLASRRYLRNRVQS
jgi:hypothetical protein